MPDPRPHPDQVPINRVAKVALYAGVLIMALKFVVFAITNSAAVLTDALESIVNLVAAAMMIYSLKVAYLPADREHPYGHGKIENVSSFGEAGLMAISCVWIIWEAMNRIVHNSVELKHSVWPVLVLLTSIGVDWWRSRQLSKVAKQTGSPALATDAFHFASDIWSTLAVLVGLGASFVGQRYGIDWLVYADPFAAIVVSLMILRLTLHLGRETVDALMDHIPAETRRRLIDEVERVPGVMAVEQARVRRSGATYFGGDGGRAPGAAEGGCGDPHDAARGGDGEHL